MDRKKIVEQGKAATRERLLRKPLAEIERIAAEIGITELPSKKWFTSDRKYKIGLIEEIAKHRHSI